jgi:hypothetical protein
MCVCESVLLRRRAPAKPCSLDEVAFLSLCVRIGVRAVRERSRTRRTARTVALLRRRGRSVGVLQRSGSFRAWALVRRLHAEARISRRGIRAQTARRRARYAQSRGRCVAQVSNMAVYFLLVSTEIRYNTDTSHVEQADRRATRAEHAISRRPPAATSDRPWFSTSPCPRASTPTPSAVEVSGMHMVYRAIFSRGGRRDRVGGDVAAAFPTARARVRAATTRTRRIVMAHRAQGIHDRGRDRGL